MRYSIRIFPLFLLLLAASWIFAQEDGGASTGDVTFALPITEDLTYVVRTGDTLDTIAAAFDVSLACLRETNGLSASAIIHPDDRLLISVECPFYTGMSTVEFPRTVARESSEAGTYIVRARQTLDEIAQELDISLVSLRQANDIDDVRDVVPGMALTIPEDAPPYGTFPALDTPDLAEGGGVGGGLEGELYVVQPGDTLDAIAQEYDVAAGIIRLANELETGQIITPGQTLLIPQGEGIPAYGEVVPLDFMALMSGEGIGGGVEGELYIVQRGDTLDTIGQAFNVSVVSLRLANDMMESSTLRIGQTLIIPAGAPAYGLFPALDTPDTGEGDGVGGGFEGELYVVQVNDNIDQIAADFNAATSCIVEANEIINVRAIKPGQTLLIPAGCPAYAGAAVPRATPLPAPAAPVPQTTEEAPETEGAG